MGKKEPLKIFTVDEVKEHNDEKSAYTIIDDKVYDLTKFLERHPGGDEILIYNSGKDSSQAFDDVGHSVDAEKLLKKYLIGEIQDSEKKLEKKESGSRKWFTTCATVNDRKLLKASRRP